jgi:hypothetical protein
MPNPSRQVALDFNLTYYQSIVRFDEQKILFKIHNASRARADFLANLPVPGKVVSAKAGCGRSGNKTGSQPRVSPPRRRTEGGFFI